jgi:hypothetical protein
VHKISAKLIFCEKESSGADKIEKTLSTMLLAHMILQQQYRQRGFTIYSKLIETLIQAERHDELLLWNSNKGPMGSKPLPEVHANTQKRKQKGAIQNNNLETSNTKNKRKRQNKPRVLRVKTILSLTETSPKLVRGVVATTTRLRSVAPQST